MDVYLPLFTAYLFMFLFLKNHLFALTIGICILFNGFMNVLNIEQIRQKSKPGETINAGSLVKDQTIYSIDNEYYLSPADNYVHGKGWKRSPAVSDGDYFRRVPGYSLVYLLFYKLFGSEHLWFFLKLFQFLLFTLTIPLFYRICTFLANGIGPKIATVVYAATPMVGGWVFYTITEGITPELTVLYLYFTYKGFQSIEKRKKTIFYSLAMVFLTYLVLTRPYAAITGLILVFAALKDLAVLKRRFIAGFSFVFLIGFVGIGSWALRNYRLTGEVVFLEKAYHPQSLDRMKPEFRGMFSFAKCWGEDGDQFNKYHQPFYFAALAGDTRPAEIQKVIDQLPPAVVSDFGNDRLSHVLKLHQTAIAIQKPYYEEEKAQPDTYFPEQLKAEAAYNRLIKEYKQKHFFKYWISSPFTYLKRMIVHSNTAHVFIFQGTISLPLRIYKALLLLVHLFIYAAIIFNVFRIKKRFEYVVYVITPLLFIFFFSFVHREIEQRYMLPVLPVMIIGSSLLLTDISNKFGLLLGRFRKTER